ncbi:diguanylate cyclase (plasmid) [Gemmatirosa kalamazoonensis]|uniref:diguanylate cyclase n=1 Tax=Gemmatirosa kalamazoonensis TaxID=861299 RepID=W0RRU1_9BACT|nr:diguanylate cyclase response regulator [Gemmatirosa kalamazoonensis]AHG93421.1 diguanylate cyclase [Gemmatirosa kalamazoonensis]
MNALSILLVEDNPIHARLARAAVETADQSWRLTCVTTLGAACAMPAPPDLVLLDLTLPDSSGLETLARVRERFGGTPVVLLTASDDRAIEEQALAAGAQDFLGKDELTPRTLRRAIRYAVERHRVQQELLQLSTRDELTELYNRRGFFAAAERLTCTAERRQSGADRSFVVVYADMDGLKEINDTFGHAAGDQAIQEAAWVLRHAFRAADVIARLGGDEFAVLVADAGPECIPILLDRLATAQARKNGEAGRRFRISLSVGAASAATSTDASLDTLLAEADAAAYLRKSERRRSVIRAATGTAA